MEKPHYVPEFVIQIDQVKGLTTDIFTLSLNLESEPPPNERIHCRWDWQGDSVFDTNFSDDLEIHHRFYKPGNYRLICESMGIGGGISSNSITVDVEQGYSAPKAAFKALPETGHFKTEFLLDAGISFDDEDSLETLKFRWDFQHDGLWDTEYSSETKVYHNFVKMGDYIVNLEVMDPGKRVGSFSNLLVVHKTDTCIVPYFTWSSENGRVSDIFTFDASSSHHTTQADRVFNYSWHFPEQAISDLQKVQ